MDARSAAVGGSAIANGYGVHGALDNPSSLVRLHRQQQRFHMHLGATVDIQDDAGIIDSAIDEDTLLTDLEKEIDSITGQELTCDLSSTLDSTCLDNTQKLGELATTVFDIISRADNQPIKAAAAAEFGVALSTWSVPVALYYRVSASGASTTDVATDDLDYVNAFANALSDDKLTLDELISNVPFNISADGQTLSVQQPEDVLESEAQGSVVVREQFGLSLARSFPVAGFNVDVGITPKFSKLTAAGVSADIADQFNDNVDSLTDQLEDSEISENTFTVDLGASTQLQSLPLRLSVVARNMVEESITTAEDIVIETTPQLIVGSAFSIGSRIRAGVSHDNARTADATGLSLGVSLGPLHIGGRLTERQSAQAGAQLAFSF